LADAADDKPQGTRVNLRRALELLRQRGDLVGQSSLSRYVEKYADAIEPDRKGREVFVSFDTLAQHRATNINMGCRPEARRSAPAAEFAAPIARPRGRADEAALNIRAQRQIRELEIAERIGELTPTREVRAAAVEALSALRSAFALSLNDSAAALASAFNLEPRLVRPHLKTFERIGLDAFARSLAEKDLIAELEQDEEPPAAARADA